MRTPSLHTNFFSSLEQVEKRLKLENPLQPSAPSPATPCPPPPPHLPGESNYTVIESLSSPMYLKFDLANSSSNNNSSSLQDSEPPREFLSNSLDFPPIHEDPPPEITGTDPQRTSKVELNDIDKIESLIQELGLSECEEGEEQKKDGVGLKSGGGGTCSHECGFFAKIVGTKGPKCGKELERLEGWIKLLLTDGGGEGRREPLRLAHLLLAKAAFLSEDTDGFGRLEFPSTIEEFLQNDPPKD